MQFLIRVLPSFKASCIVTCITLVCVFRSGHCGELFYNRDIRPILSENCFTCHGQDGNKRQADLRLDHRESAIEKGAIVPGNAGASTLLERIHSSDTEIVMPPPDSIRRLSDRQKEVLTQWIREGATYEPHWSFSAPVRPIVPELQRADWARTEIDRFILSQLESQSLTPSPEADRSTLMKRLYVDLIGLPPSPAEVDNFVADTDPQAYENLVDRLLANPHYGERMALPWLDAARYADSNGFQQDGDTWQWIWRDWVVSALNADMPFDQFSIEQLAGDLLPNATNQQKIASGFNRNHLLNGEGGSIAEEQRNVILFDRIDTTATTWLGLTMACAQCHDHKYDPLTQVDYYSLLDAFNRVPESGVPQFFSSRIRVAPPILEMPTEENNRKIAEFEASLKSAEAEAIPIIDAAFAGWSAGLAIDEKPFEGKGFPDALTELLKKPKQDRTDAEKTAMAQGLRKHFDEKVKAAVVGKTPLLEKVELLKKQLADYRGDQLPRVMIMSDSQPRETKRFDRGDYLSPKETVSFSTPAFLPPQALDAPRNRLGFAQWLFAPNHPLTARVQVNRMWQHFFGVGLAKTTEDLGVQSEYPLHKELLDWLSVEFQERQWSRKAMHRLIVTSAVYRQSGRLSPELQSLDPDNRLHARASRFRMPSMLLRDWVLSASGLSNFAIGGPPTYPYQPDAIWEALAITKERDFTYPASHGADLYRRSLYTFWRRTVGPANMFDSANRQTCRVRSSTTSTPLHALTTLNDPTWVEAARMLAQKSMQVSTDLEERLVYAFRQVVSRQPTHEDLQALTRTLNRQKQIYQADAESAKALVSVGESSRDESLDVVDHAAMSAVCLAIFNLDEAMSRE